MLSRASALFLTFAMVGCSNGSAPVDARTDNPTASDTSAADRHEPTDVARDERAAVDEGPGLDVGGDTAVDLDTGSVDAPASDAPRRDVLDAGASDAGMRADITDVASDAGARADITDVASDAAVTACTGRTGAVGDRDITFTSGGMTRRYLIHVPASYRPTRPMQVVLNYHGFNNTGMSQNGMSGMNTAADARGFIAVHPYGTNAAGMPPNLSWNAGRCCGDAPGRRVDDVQFTREMLDRIEAEYCVDTRRVFATGWSNGAMLTHRLACELADRIAAIAPVSGTLGVSTCVPSRPIAVLTTHGTADMNVPWDGGPPGNTEPVPVTIAGWAMRDRCTDPSPTEIFRLGTRHCDTRRACAAGVEVELCTIEGGGHNWSNTPPTMTTTQILDFFALHPMP